MKGESIYLMCLCRIVYFAVQFTSYMLNIQIIHRAFYFYKFIIGNMWIYLGYFQWEHILIPHMVWPFRTCFFGLPTQFYLYVHGFSLSHKSFRAYNKRHFCLLNLSVLPLKAVGRVYTEVHIWLLQEDALPWFLYVGNSQKRCLFVSISLYF